MKKIQVTHLTFDMRIGGAEQVILNLVENTDPEKFEVSILCIEKPLGPFGKQLQRKGFSIHCFNRKPGFDWSLIKQIRKFILSSKTDILHCHQYSPFVYGVLAAALTPCRIVFTEHGRFYPDTRKLKRVLLNPCLNLLTGTVTAISEATRTALIEYENFPANKVRVIYNGINPDRFSAPSENGLKEKLGLPADAFVNSASVSIRACFVSSGQRPG